MVGSQAKKQAPRACCSRLSWVTASTASVLLVSAWGMLAPVLAPMTPAAYLVTHGSPLQAAATHVSQARAGLSADRFAALHDGLTDKRLAAITPVLAAVGVLATVVLATALIGGCLNHRAKA